MAKRRKRRSVRRKKRDEYPGWVWLIFGLAIGLSVAFAIYVKDRAPIVAAQPAAENPASMQSAVDDNGELPPPDDEAPVKRRFTFYTILPDFEVITPDREATIEKDIEPRAVEEPGLYILQAGSFSTNKDADRRRAELALHGIESHVQRVKVNARNYHRVYIGPIDDLDELNMLRSRLRVAKIDVLLIRLSD